MQSTPGIQGWFQIQKPINTTSHISEWRIKITWSHQCKKASDKIQCLFIRNTLNRWGVQKINSTYKGHIWKATIHHHLQKWKIESFVLRLRIRQGFSLLPLLFNIVPEFLARAIRQEKEIKGIQMRKKEVKLSVCRCYYLICRNASTHTKC